MFPRAKGRRTGQKTRNNNKRKNSKMAIRKPTAPADKSAAMAEILASSASGSEFKVGANAGYRHKDSKNRDERFANTE